VLAVLVVILLRLRLVAQQATDSGDFTEESRIELRQLRQPVTVRRDDLGIPYIQASNENDLYLAQGYVVASDRFWQMEVLRRTARGEMAEVCGRSALEADRQHRILGLVAVATKAIRRLPAPEVAALERYADGVNAYIESHAEKRLPPEFRSLGIKPRRWLSIDSILVGKLLSESLGTTWETDLMRGAMRAVARNKRDTLLADKSPLDLIVVGSDAAPTAGSRETASPGSQTWITSASSLGAADEILDAVHQSLLRVGLYAQELAASNSWVVDGSRSMTGKPLLANDPHLSPSAPSIWYMAHLTAPALRVAGVTIPGVPGIVIGHNDRIAWGITNVEADVQDLYHERLNGKDHQFYETPRGWKEAEQRSEPINVRASPVGRALDTVECRMTLTRHGPIVLDDGDEHYALAWTALDPSADEIGVYQVINHARDWPEFRAALSKYSGCPLNFIYADVEGHIGYWAAGRYPIRRSGEGTVPYDGSLEDGDWTGYIPFEETPHVYDPPARMIVTANNRIVGTDYPFYISHQWAAPYRARRIHDLLAAIQRLTVSEFRDIQADTYSFPDATFAAQVARVARDHAAESGEWREMVTAFEGFDGMMKADSRVAPVVYAMRDSFRRRILVGALGPELAKTYEWPNADTVFASLIETEPIDWLPPDCESYEVLLLACYRDAQKALAERIGEDRTSWTWGHLKQVRFPHALARLPFIGAQFSLDPVPQNGGDQSVNRGANVSMRLIVDLLNLDQTRMGIPLGESGNPTNKHWKDQLKDWQAVTPPAFPFSGEAVQSAAKHILVLTPSII